MNVSVTLSVSQLDKTISKLLKYERELEVKNEVFVKRLMEETNPVIQERMTSGETGSDAGEDSSREYTTEKVTNKADARVTGTLTLFNESIMFWEFGAGVYYNGLAVGGYASKFGYGPGTYPGQTHVPDPGYWYYNKKKSYGTEATMPMYYSMQKMREERFRVAREVFGSGKQ